MKVIAAWILCTGLTPAPAQAADAENGKKIHQSKCSSCHGSQGEGNVAMERGMKLPPGALNLRDQDTLKKSDSDLAGIIEKGSRAMPAYQGKLKGGEIQDLLAYLRGLGAGAAGRSKTTVDGASLYAKNCASCHGKNGKGNPAMAKIFKVAPEALDLSDKATLDKKDAELEKTTAEGVGKMPGYGKTLNAEEISALTAHVRSTAGAPTYTGDKP